MLQNIRYYTEYTNLIIDNSKIDILFCRFAKLSKNQKIIVISAFLSVIVVFYNINTTVFYLYYSLNTSVTQIAIAQYYKKTTTTNCKSSILKIYFSKY